MHRPSLYNNGDFVHFFGRVFFYFVRFIYFFVFYSFIFSGGGGVYRATLVLFNRKLNNKLMNELFT